MHDSKSHHHLKFDDLLNKFAEQQKADTFEQDPAAILDKKGRHSLLKLLTGVYEENGDHPLFDRTSLHHIEKLFDISEEFFHTLREENHPAHLLYKSPEAWFHESYKFMYNAFNLLEIVRFFAGGTTGEEKEFIFSIFCFQINQNASND